MTMHTPAEITPDQLQRWRRRTVDLTYRELSEITGRHLRTWQKWCLGDSPLPPDIHILMEYVERQVGNGTEGNP
jgi:hypothetical protein